MPKLAPGRRSSRAAAYSQPCVLFQVALARAISKPTHVRNAQSRSPTPVGPPWKLISPTGVRHVFEDREAISIFCADEQLELSNIEHLLGLSEGNTSQPKHVKFWQPQHLLLFLRRHGSTELVPVLGGPGKGRCIGDAGVDHFIRMVAQSRADMPFGSQHASYGQNSLVVALICARQHLPRKWPPTPLYSSKNSLRGLEEKVFHCKGGRRKK